MLWVYGVTQERFEQMLADQNGCAICHRTEPTDKGWQVDHDHGCCPGFRSCGECVRGVLCAPCNVGLGAFGDDPERLAAAAAYLRPT